MCKAAALSFRADWMAGVWGKGGGKSMWRAMLGLARRKIAYAAFLVLAVRRSASTRSGSKLIIMR